MTPKIQIITLYCGENEYDACKASVKSQTYGGTIDHVFIEHLPNIAAHKKCYQTIMDGVDTYDLFIKMDADMVFTRDTAVSDIINYWNAQNQPDHMVFAVHDFIPDRLSIGIHVFTKNCTWDLDTHDGLFVDPNPHYDGHSTKTFDAPAPFVSHAANPSDAAAYHFGIHRALKAFQYGRFLKQPQGLEAFRILQSTANHYKRTQDPKTKLALMGAESVRRRLIDPSTGDKSDIDIMDLNVDFWMHPVRAKIWWWMVIGIRTLPIWAYRRFKK
jgi:hypothetical protein